MIHACAAAVVAGAWLAVVLPIEAGGSLAVAVLCVSLAAPSDRRRIRLGLATVGVGALAAAGAASARDQVLAPPLGLWFAAESRALAGAAVPPVRLRGVLVEDAAEMPAGHVRLRLHVEAVQAEGGWLPASGLVQLNVYGEQAGAAAEAWTRGRRAEVTATLRWPAVLNNPGGTPPGRQRLVRGYVLSGSVKSALLVDVAPGPWWHETPSAVRRYVRHTAARRFGDDRRVTAAVVTAILIGDRGGLDADLRDRLMAAGTYHVIAISGGNVALITFVVVVVLKRLLRSPRLVPLAALAAVLAYGWTVDAEPSVTRAVATAVVWLSIEALGLRAPPARIFSLVVIVVVLMDPLMVVMPGAWLSFGATLGILACAGRLAAWLADRSGQPAGAGGWRRVVRPVAALGAATLAAELVLLPVGAATFSRVGVAGVVLNFIAIPAMAIVQLAGIVALLPDPVAMLSGPAVLAAHAGAVALVDSARLVDWAPFVAWRVPPPPAAVVLVYYAALGLVLAGAGRARVQRVARGIALVMLLVIMAGPSAVLARPAPGTLRVTLLDVGQGDAAVVQLPGGHVLVVDGGAAGEGFDTGARVVAPALWALGARTVDWVAFTHADLDHIGGIAAVMADFAPAEVWEGIPVWQSRERDRVRQRADDRRLVWRELRRGDRWSSGGALVEVLHPPIPDWQRPRVRNDDSIVLRIRYGPLDVLLTGDVGADIERELPLGDSPGPIRILKVAHHGSRTSSGPALLARYRPWLAVISVGRNNPFGHPAPDVLARLAEAGATTLRTDRDGAVMIECDGREVIVRSWNGKSWHARAGPT